MTYGGTVQRDRLQRFFESTEWRAHLPKLKRFYYYKAFGERRMGSMVISDWGLLDANGNRTRPIYCYFRTKIRPGSTC